VTTPSVEADQFLGEVLQVATRIAASEPRGDFQEPPEPTD
jgi:hypothetical protein